MDQMLVTNTLTPTRLLTIWNSPRLDYWITNEWHFFAVATVWTPKWYDALDRSTVIYCSHEQTATPYHMKCRIAIPYRSSKGAFAIPFM